MVNPTSVAAFMVRYLVILIIPLVCLSLLPSPAVSQTPRLQRVYFAPLGELQSIDLDALTAHYQERFGITIGVLPDLRIAPDLVDADRQQLIAEEAISRLRTTHQAVESDPGALLIGLTEEDLAVRSIPEWRFAFALRTQGRYAVISSARMDPLFFGEPADADLLHTRLRKMITRVIGFYYFGLPASFDPRSVLYTDILGLDDLDAVSEEF
jgi:predicted Zn-dependent protease